MEGRGLRVSGFLELDVIKSHKEAQQTAVSKRQQAALDFYMAKSHSQKPRQQQQH